VSFCRLLQTRTKYAHEDLRPLAELLLRIILASQWDLAATTRWSMVMSRLLRRHARGMGLVAPWRPLLALLRGYLFTRTQSYESADFSKT